MPDGVTTSSTSENPKGVTGGAARGAVHCPLLPGWVTNSMGPDCKGTPISAAISAALSGTDKNCPVRPFNGVSVAFRSAFQLSAMKTYR
jgi:hypothetical protein